MDVIKVYVESGKKKVFVGAMDWPGWCRSGKTEEDALQSLIEYGPRYAKVLKGTGINFELPTSLSDLKVIERHTGDATTDYGAPGSIPEGDSEPYNEAAFKRDLTILEACWKAFDQAASQAEGKELRKGPRGGGRDLEKMVAHLLESDKAYLSKIAWKHKLEEGEDRIGALKWTREAIGEALDKAVNEGLPGKGPRGGVIWPARYFVRRVAWHVLDHAWEIEDRGE